VIEEDVVPGGPLNLNSSPSGKIPMVGPGIEPGTS